ncbi:MAG: hypothetical protein J6S43_01650 [Lentisphaeria bacterium]|nr:hypothetical protein [Lentisphaeria bacterium]
MKFLPAAVIALLLAGCVNIDYTGRKFTAQNAVRYSENRDEVPQGYSIIGRFTVSSWYDVHPYEVEDAVLEKAGEYGGDILCLTSSAVVRHGVYTPNEREFGAPDIRERKIPETETGLFGTPAPLESATLQRKRRIFNYLLYKKTAEINRQSGL